MPGGVTLQKEGKGIHICRIPRLTIAKQAASWWWSHVSMHARAHRYVANSLVFLTVSNLRNAELKGKGGRGAKRKGKGGTGRELEGGTLC